MRLGKMIIALVGATMFFSVVVASASARNFSISERRLSATFARVEFSGGFGTIRCNITLSRTLHGGTIPKVLETLIGYMTAASVGGCEAGSATILSETLPWHLRYVGFLGRLPDIIGIIRRIVGWAMKIREPFGIECLSTSTAASPVTETMNREAGGRLTSLTLGGTVPTSCGINGTLRGTSNSVTPVPVITLI